MTDPDDEELSPQSEANKAYYDEFFKLKDNVILLALREAEWYYEARGTRDTDERRQMTEAVSDAFEDAAREFVFFMMRPVPE